jgi:guanylate kinase
LKKILYTATGPSGVGKSTLFEAAFGIENMILSFTTRKPRISEVDGVDYHFISKEKFDELDEQGGLFEKETYAGNYYGITQEEFENKIQNDCYFVTNVGGLKQIKEKYDKVVSYFIVSPIEDVEKQLRARGDNEKDIAIRLSKYKEDVEELTKDTKFDVVFINEYGKFDEMVEKLKKQIKG